MMILSYDEYIEEARGTSRCCTLHYSNFWWIGVQQNYLWRGDSKV